MEGGLEAAFIQYGLDADDLEFDDKDFKKRLEDEVNNFTNAYMALELLIEELEDKVEDDDEEEDYE